MSLRLLDDTTRSLFQRILKYIALDNVNFDTFLFICLNLLVFNFRRSEKLQLKFLYSIIRYIFMDKESARCNNQMLI